MNRWDIVLLVVAGYVATGALVRLMIRRRDELVDEVRRRFKKKKMRKKADLKEEGEVDQQRKVA
jgi:hypothetical protein